MSWLPKKARSQTKGGTHTPWLPEKAAFVQFIFQSRGGGAFLSFGFHKLEEITHCHGLCCAGSLLFFSFLFRLPHLPLSPARHRSSSSGGAHPPPAAAALLLLRRRRPLSAVPLLPSPIEPPEVIFSPRRPAMGRGRASSGAPRSRASGY